MAEFVLKAHHRPSAADHPPEGKKRFRLIVEYDGTDYCGWQRQENGPSVQQCLEEAIQALIGEKCTVTGSSRTDSGVHAMGLSAHFDSATRIPADRLALALNTKLPPDIRIRESMPAPAGFHARFSACGKVYCYRWWNGRQDCAIGRQYRAHIPVRLDDAAMDEAAQRLLGKHDFTAFCAKGSVVSSNVRTLHRIRVRRIGDEVELTVLGDGFLYNMVRIIAGTLGEIGKGQLSPDTIDQALESGDRRLLGMTAPAKGLTLVRVLYEGDEETALSYFDS